MPSKSTKEVKSIIRNNTTIKRLMVRTIRIKESTLKSMEMVWQEPRELNVMQERQPRPLLTTNVTLKFSTSGSPNPKVSQMVLFQATMPKLKNIITLTNTTKNNNNKLPFLLLKVNKSLSTKRRLRRNLRKRWRKLSLRKKKKPRKRVKRRLRRKKRLKRKQRRKPKNEDLNWES